MKLSIMKRLFLFLLIFSSCQIIKAQSKYLTIGNLKQIFIIQTDTLQGTAFLITNNSEEYLATVAHIFKSDLSTKSIVNIKLLIDTTFVPVQAKFLRHPDISVDIAVLKLPFNLKHSETLNEKNNIVLGQDVFFVGYPSFNNIQFITIAKGLGAFPLIKKAILSGSIQVNNYYLLLLDGHNNPGFSGGPVIYYDENLKQNCLLGIVSGYFNESKAIIEKKQSKESDYINLENSGIIICYPIKLAHEIIKLN